MAAGQKFLAVVEQSPEDCRALGNWGNALCLRAELAQDPEASPFQYVPSCIDMQEPAPVHCMQVDCSKQE